MAGPLGPLRPYCFRTTLDLVVVIVIIIIIIIIIVVIVVIVVVDVVVVVVVVVIVVVVAHTATELVATTGADHFDRKLKLGDPKADEGLGYLFDNDVAGSLRR